MERKTVSGVVLMLLLTSIFPSAFIIQPIKASGTIYIRPDGSIDPPTAPIERVGIFYIYYTFTDNIHDEIVVQRSDIIIDGAGHTLQGNGTGIAIYLGPYLGPTLVSNITVKNVNIKDFQDGIKIKHSSNNKIYNNTIVGNSRFGIELWGVDSSNNHIYNNTVTDNLSGIELGPSATYNNISINIVKRNKWGIVLGSAHNTLRNNTMARNDFNFWTGDYINDVDTSNTVDGKPIYYWINEKDKTVPLDAGYVALMNSENITVKNLKIKNNFQGITLYSTENSKITQNTLIDNAYAIDVHGSSYNSITDNLIVGFTFMLAVCGISLDSYSSFNNISGNVIMQHQWWCGMRLYDANNNYVYENVIMSNKEGIWLKDSENNVFYHNNFMNNQKQVVLEWTWGSLPNVWHMGYPDGGNYWDDYIGVDEFSGPNQDIPGSDGIGDIPYEIDGYYDLYPLMDPKSFTPIILLISPIGGESWLVGSFQSIRWISLGVTGNVTIELSTDGGSTWEEKLFPNTVNDGYEGWRVMAYLGNDLRIRVASLDYPAISDVSDNDFTISTVSTTNTFPVGYCTWWAYERRAQLGMPVSWLDDMPRPRDAWKWIDFAEQAGIPSGLQPRVGAIAVWGTTPTNSFGHVAIVEWVGEQEEEGDNSTFYISEMNFGSFVDPDQGITVNFRKVTDRTLALPRPPEENFLGFIYGAAIPENQPPVASFTYSPESPFYSGASVSFDASGSYDPEGGEISYKWDFGGGTAAEGKIVSHRFRGAQNEPKTYTVTLTVEDNNGAADTDAVQVTVAPLKRTVEFYDPPILVRMTVIYNWIEKSGGEDIYIVSKIHVEAEGFVGTFVPAIWVWEYLYPMETLVPVIDFLDYLFVGGRHTEKTYESPFSTKPVIGISPPIARRTFAEGTFEGIQVKGSDAMSICAQGFKPKLGWPPIDVKLFEFSATPFDPLAPSAEPGLLQKLLDELLDLLVGQLGSPGELRVYDVQGRVTGLVNGKVREEIPTSVYFNNTVMILSSNSSNRYEVAGTEDGSYGLLVASFVQGESYNFTATDIAISTNAIHQYTIDWDALSQGEEGVTVKVDSDGDGIFEKTFTADKALTRDEFMLQVTPVETFPMWIVGVAVAAIAMATAAMAVSWRRRKQPPIKE